VESQSAREFLMETLSLKKSTAKAVEQSVANGVCLIEGCGCKAVSRGLCSKHRAQFYRNLYRHASTSKRVAFERNAIEQGLILPVGEVRRINGDAFSSARVG
jgi:hypothetical protein